MAHQTLSTAQILVAPCAERDAEEVAVPGQRFDFGLGAPFEGKACDRPFRWIASLHGRTGVN